MPLSPMELNQERLAQLRRLAQSPAWELLRARWLKAAASRDEAKARLLREGNFQAAVIEQGKVDGLAEAMSLLEVYMKELQVVEEPDPAY